MFTGVACISSRSMDSPERHKRASSSLNRLIKSSEVEIAVLTSLGLEPNISALIYIQRGNGRLNCSRTLSFWGYSCIDRRYFKSHHTVVTNKMESTKHTCFGRVTIGTPTNNLHMLRKFQHGVQEVEPEWREHLHKSILAIN